MTPVPDDDAARTGVSDGSLHLPSSPVRADRVRWFGVGATLVAALALLAAQATGYAATLGVTLVLSLAVAWGWPLLSGSHTPTATTGALAVSSVAIVLSALRQDLLWVPAAVAFGILLAFFGQLVRRPGREGLVLTLLSAFGGLAVIASGTTAVVAANSDRGQAVAVVAMAAVGAAVVVDLLPGVRALVPYLALVALGVSVLAAFVAATRFAEVGALEAVGVGAAVGTVSWSFRRVLSLQPAMLTRRGQVGAGAGSVLVVGAVVHLFSVLT